ncbi:heptaprenyl diphosphate synthase component 1 [Bacillus sp. WMMC1349]|uniref:heptaprenyl diphosphate synthase component 1 n=1 Tax=Bacillus sp. WMMC1349 TaxID=2736254 RepID=UPI0015540DEC|nr:heptaprenyl diphosphate synthase component 1 [Bacillus sp. WMMC1349]NPC92791.1 heptaprenyl diphosphate synthase component 1 [Bacillus sp. WMMC1349]
MQDIYRHLSHLKMKLNQKLSHPYLAKHLTAPKVDEDKLFLFNALFDETDLKEADKENYILTAMLVQTALDTHDEVTTAASIRQDDNKNRQLTVLAGDYFSGMYYSLLSGMKDIYMIRMLAAAIKEINEHKIRIYDHSTKDLDSLKKSISIVEASLFHHLADHFHLPHWKSVANDFLVFKRLVVEAKQTNSRLVETILQEEFSADQAICEQLAEEAYEKAKVEISQYLVKQPGVQKWLLDRLQEIKPEKRTYHQKVEEG